MMDGKSTTRLVAALLVLLCLLLPGLSFAAQKPLKGVALVIGQSQYQHVAVLNNTILDARVVDRLLGDLGFETRLAIDRDASRLARDLERFLEDVAGADVALVYYAGHGIEAGGENYLVPVDADTAALNEPGRNLVAVSSFIARLKATVPVALVFLDACRTNPFPAGAAILSSDGLTKKAVSQYGLAATRGMETVDEPAASENVGTVIGFAAEPGQVALDGSAGGNSPYAAALIRHLAALKGAEFGDVMTMVTEEVYLATKGRQRPWTNASLRRLLYFGVTGEGTQDDEALITGERRQLLLTIATLPLAERSMVEAAARSDEVPLDALYGMLKILGRDLPQDPAERDRVLREQAGKLRDFAVERQALSTSDAEIIRLSSLAERAIAQGAIQTAIRFREDAKRRAGEIASSLETLEEEIKKRRLELAQVYAKSAQTYVLAFDHRRAAADYALAYSEARRWSTQNALGYRIGEADALLSLAIYRGDDDAFQQAAIAYESALGIFPEARKVADTDIPHEQDIRRKLSIAYTGALTDASERTLVGLQFGDGHAALQDVDQPALEQAVRFYQEELSSLEDVTSPFNWAAAYDRLGNAYLALGEREQGTASLGKAVAAYESALAIRSRDLAPSAWATTQSNLALAFVTMSRRQSDTASLLKAIAAYRAALEVRPRADKPLSWAATQNGLGNAYLLLSYREGRPVDMEQSIGAFEAALTERTRSRVPLAWATSQNGMGEALFKLGEIRNDPQLLSRAAAAFELALGERTKDRAPYAWATTQRWLGDTLRLLVSRDSGTATLSRAAAAYDAALSVQMAAEFPLESSFLHNRLGDTLFALGFRARNKSTLLRAKQAILTAWTINREMWGETYEMLSADRIARIDNAIANLP